MQALRDIVQDLTDLVLARACAGCEAGGSVLCSHCWAHLTRGVIVHALPDGSEAHVSTHYLGIGKNVVIAHKEHGVSALTPRLGSLLAMAVTSVTDLPVTLIPIPPHAQAITRRGTDPLADLTRSAVKQLRVIGQPAEMSTLLRRTRDSGSLKRLTRHERQQAVSSSFEVGRKAALDGRAVIVVDDVITTGITVTEARRALETGGIEVAGTAAVAGTPLRPGNR